jgi:glycine/D-amino acid oxidase-like deaminating enzyme
MSDVERFQMLILGSGQGGKLLAWHLARAGRRTAVVERQWVGGSEAGEATAAVQMAMLARTPYPLVRDAVITHLTFAEGLGPLLSNVARRAA